MAQSVWTGGSHHTGLAALPHENIQSMLAEQANISVDTVKRLERGNEGSVNVLLAIADVYDVSLDYLVGCEDAAR